MHIYLGFNNDKTSRGMTLAVSRSRIFKINIRLISVIAIIAIDSDDFLEFVIFVTPSPYVTRSVSHEPVKGPMSTWF